jgi:pimeloyl-ACP methyl ester carboxylesterase
MYGTTRATSATAVGGAGLTRTVTARRITARRIAACIALLVLSAGCASAAHPAQPTAATGPHCQRERIPVRLSAAASVTYRIAGWLCADGTPQGHTVEVLIPGLTYGASYWNFPVGPARYSYVRAATAAGYATLAIDRLGTGASDHPPGAQVTAMSEASALHDVVAQLRAGKVGHVSFGKIVLVGHSYGSDIALREAAAYADVSGVISTGWLTAGNLAGHLQVRKSYDSSADEDAKFAGAELPAGYVTTKPGTRGADFYNPGYASAAVIKEDESLKQTVSAGELKTVVIPVPRAATQAIHVPVLLADGQNDALDCNAARPALSCATAGAILAREKANYAPQACLRAYVLAGAGHSINLHPDAADWFAAASNWVHTYVDASTLPASCAAKT